MDNNRKTIIALVVLFVLWIVLTFALWIELKDALSLVYI